MKSSMTISTAFLISTFATGTVPAMAQHHPAGHPAQPRGHSGMGQPSAAMLHQMRQQQQAIQREQEAMQRHYLQQQAQHAQHLQAQQAQHAQRLQAQQAQRDQRAQEAHQEHTRQFDAYLQSNGSPGQAGAAGLPTTPRALHDWAKTQKQKKASNKPYDPLYDHYGAYQDSLQASKTSAKPANSSTATVMNHSAAKPTAHPATGTTPKAGTPATRPLATTATPPAHREPTLYDRAVVNHLRFVHEQLAKADHDYAGHRVEAIRHVGQAIHHLGGSSGLGGMGAGSLGMLGGSGHLPQAKSDAILRESMSRLETAQRQLGDKSANAEHHARARTDVAEAIQRIRVALTVR